MEVFLAVGLAAPIGVCLEPLQLAGQWLTECHGELTQEMETQMPADLGPAVSEVELLALAFR